MVVLIIGLSGAGRTTAINALEDRGFEAINNFPLSLIGALIEESAGDRPIALGVESRSRSFASERFGEVVDALRQGLGDIRLVLVFLDCEDAVLARRFSETRRRHPLAPAEDVETGIARERDLLAPARADADLVIDTTALTPHDLKREIGERLAPVVAGTAPQYEGARGLSVSVSSFSYKRGMPQGADLVIDVRFLRNPYWASELRALDGRHAEVQGYVAQDPRFDAFFDQVLALLLLLLPAYADEGKVYFSVAFGCTGGRHRSVTVTERIASALHGAGWPSTVRHRELDRGPGRPGGREHDMAGARAGNAERPGSGAD
ncbi:MAG: RNase adapter RapZ [Pseudomonadota bacterium]